jgi:hypothetical protein
MDLVLGNDRSRKPRSIELGHLGSDDGHLEFSHHRVEFPGPGVHRVKALQGVSAAPTQVRRSRSVLEYAQCTNNGGADDEAQARW